MKENTSRQESPETADQSDNRFPTRNQAGSDVFSGADEDSQTSFSTNTFQNLEGDVLFIAGLQNMPTVTSLTNQRQRTSGFSALVPFEFPFEILGGVRAQCVVGLRSMTVCYDGVARTVRYYDLDSSLENHCCFHANRCRIRECPGRQRFWKLFSFYDEHEGDSEAKEEGVFEKSNMNFWNYPVALWSERQLTAVHGPHIRHFPNVLGEGCAADLNALSSLSTSPEFLLEHCSKHTRSEFKVDLLSLVSFTRASMCRGQSEQMGCNYPRLAENCSTYEQCKSALSAVVNRGSVMRRNGRILTNDLENIVNSLHMECLTTETEQKGNILQTPGAEGAILARFTEERMDLPQNQEILHVLRSESQK